MANSIVLAGCVLSVSAAATVNNSKAREIVVGFPQYGNTPDGYITVATWGKLAETSIEEGAYVIVDGVLNTHKGADNNTYTTISASNIYAIDRELTLNKVMLVGNTGNDPDVKYFDSGKSKARVSLAVRKNGNETSWFTIEGWDKSCDIIANYVRKGNQISVVGSLTQEFWKDKTTGADRSKFTIKGDRIGLLGGKKEPAGVGSAPFAAEEDF